MTNTENVAVEGASDGKKSFPSNHSSAAKTGIFQQVLLDSSIWLDYFLTGSERSRKYLDYNNFIVFSSVISIHEVKKRLLKDKYAAEKIDATLVCMKSKSIMLEVSEEISEKSASDSFELKLHASDSIIYRTALEARAELITMDSDFKGLKGVILV